MKNLCTEQCLEINQLIKGITVSENFFNLDSQTPRGFEAYRKIIEQKIKDLPVAVCNRLNQEYFGYGPIENYINDDQITEVIVNRFDSIWVERAGRLYNAEDSFYSEHTYEHFLQRLYLEINQEPTLTNPFIDSSWHGNRLHIIGEYTLDQPWVRLTIRKHKKISWTLNELKKGNWASENDISLLQKIIESRKNFLVIGPTGSGKTSVLKALLNECSQNDRILVLEDSKEIDSPNLASTHLLTRHDSRNIMTPITLTDLVRQSLRMRPDRIVVGEVRGGEAKDLLMALATGHEGSAGTLHASDASQALIRLEMLIQMGSPNWNLQAIRRLIQLSLDYLIVCSRNSSGHRLLNGIYRLISVEESGVIIERVDAF